MTEAPPNTDVAETVPGASQAEGQAPEATPEKTFTQADLKKIAANEKREGKKAAEAAFLERANQYGVESTDDVFSILESYHMTEQEMETAADKAEKAKAKAEAKAQAAEDRYTNTLREYALRDALRDSGINPERLRGAMRLADMSTLDVDREGNVGGLDEVVAAVKEEAPEFFGDGSRPRVSAPDAGSNQRSSGTGNVQEDMGRSLLGWLTEPTPDRGTFP